MGFVPPDFEVPELLEADRFRLRPLTVHDVVKDYDAVMTSRDHLWSQFGQAWGWPPADLTLEQDLIDLGWHQKEFHRRSSFAYAVMSPDESRLLGCVYVDPPQKAGYDAEVWLWVRASELAGGLDQVLYGTVRRWIEERWPFTRVAYPRPGAVLGPLQDPARPLSVGAAEVLHHRRTWIIEELYAPELAQRPVLDRAVLLVVRGRVGGEERRPGDVWRWC